MKKFVVLFAMMAIVSAGAYAQSQPAQDPQKSTQQDPQKAAQEKAEWDRTVKAELKLTPDQITKYDAVGKEFGEKIEALKADASLTDDARKEKKMALKKEKEAKLAEFLTPEQQAKYRELVEKKMKKETAKTGA
jgi:Spy/CpxP family protein refolding chaperone